ncbi:unnamed protein product [Microthlaspi erraticum]|uniref:GOST seven transmembrane domain-containing protein n=1 Tax=Microthlaspi erraticum TaxID=1685480 RepID=A0A6D2IN07_9BRAS|nr:unnamed protein product [Microthlaspi erraticum]
MSQFQHLITMLIALGMFETAVHYYEYAEFNKTGTRPQEVTVWQCGIVLQPTLDGFTPRMLLLGGVYFLAREADELFGQLGSIDDFAGRRVENVAFPSALMDSLLIVWVFVSLSGTLDRLRVRY